MSSQFFLLTDPFLQFPTETSVRVVWFTEFAGQDHTVSYGKKLSQTAIARTTQLSRTREDGKSWIETQQADGTVFPTTTRRKIWRHEAEITGLIPGQKMPYRVTSIREDGQRATSNEFTLSAAPKPGQPLKILLTSDHQLKPMTAANLQKVEETVGHVDAIFLAGDLVNIPDRASEWFDDRRGGAFFPCLQGRANYHLEKDGTIAIYKGGKLIQNAPLFPAIGNHEVMGCFSEQKPLNDQFYDAVPRQVYEKLIDATEANTKSKEQEIKNNSFNTDTYEELFSFPGHKTYYAVTLGDIRLVVLYATTIWRFPQLDPKLRGKYQEKEEDFNHPKNWGYGQHIFEPIAKGSQQYQWLEQELKGDEFKQAKYKIVMFHHPPHTLGHNGAPAYTDPVQKIDRDHEGNITAIRYEYPRENDYIIRDVLPLLEAAKVQLVFYGHSHLWNRFIGTNGMQFLESSNVGNSYGAYIGKNLRRVPKWNDRDYIPAGDPNGLEPVIPTIAPIIDEMGQPMPYIASNDITVFSILETEIGTISSYHFDTRKPNSPAVKFDEFALKL